MKEVFPFLLENSDYVTCQSLYRHKADSVASYHPHGGSSLGHLHSVRVNLHLHAVEYTEKVRNEKNNLVD